MLSLALAVAIAKDPECEYAELPTSHIERKAEDSTFRARA